MTFTNPGTQPKNVHTIAEAGKTAVWCFGRMNPPHFGHEGLIKLVETTAAGKHADWFIFVSKSQDKNKNPLPYAEKVNWIYTLFPQTKGHLVEDPSIKTFMQAAAWLYAKGYRSVVFVAGEDDMTSMRSPLEQYNGKQVAHGFYQFDPLTFVESPRLTTATNAREAAKSGNEEAFYAATRVSETATVNNKTLFQAVRAGLGLPVNVAESFSAAGLDKPTPTVADLVKQHRVSRQKVNHALGQGIRVEMEHTNDVDVAREIALDHLAERLDYYDRLRKVETEDMGATNPTSQMVDRAVAVNPFDYYTPFMDEDVKLDEVNLKAVRQFGSDPRLDDVKMGWELEMIWPDHDDGRHDDDYEASESEPDWDADEAINDNSVDAFRRDIMNFFVGDHNGTRDVRNVLDGFLEDYYTHLGDKWDELYDDEDEDVRREVADRMESGKDEDTAKDEAKDDWIADNKDDMLADYLTDEVDITSMHGFREHTDNDLNWPVWTEPEYGYGREKGELTREDLKMEFMREFRDMLIQDGFKVDAINSPHKNKRMDTWYFEPDGSLNPQDETEGGVELTTPPIPYKRSMEYLQKVFAWAKSHGAWTGTDGDTGFHMSFSLPSEQMKNVDWVKMILMGGDDRVLRDFDRWANGNNNWAKSALKHIRDTTSRGGDINSDMIIDAIRSGLTPEARREAMKYMSRGKYTSVHPKGGSDDGDDFTYVEFRSAGGDALGQIHKVEDAALQYARSIILAADPAAERQEYAKKLYKMVAKVKADEPGLRALKDFADGKIDKETLKFKLGRAAVARGQSPKYQPTGNVYMFKIIPGGGRSGPDIEIIAPTLMAAIPRAHKEARNNNTVPSYYYNLATEPDERMFRVETENGIGPVGGGFSQEKRAGVIVLAANGAEAAETGSQLLGLPVLDLRVTDVTKGMDLDDLARFENARWTTKEQIAAAKAAQDKAEAERNAAAQKATAAGGQKYKIVTALNGNPPAYSPSTHTQIANSPEDAVTKFMAANQIAEPFREYYRALPADQPDQLGSVFSRDTQQPAASPQPNPPATQAGTYIITYLSPTGRQDQTAYDTNSAREAEILFRAQHPTSYQIVSIEQHNDQTESLAESMLAEVNMGPGALADFAKSDLGKSIRVGFEAEMLVPDMSDSEPKWDDDTEPNWDENTGINFNRSWRDQIRRFWRDGDYNYASTREIDRAIEAMDEQYQEYVDEQFQDYLDSKEGMAALMTSVRENEAGTADLSDEEIGELDDYANFLESATDDVRDRWTSEYLSDDNNFVDWAEDNSLGDMIGFSNRFDLSWPYQTIVSRGGSVSMESLSKEFSKFSGYPTKVGSYSTRPDDKTGVFKDDSSIKRLDLPDSYAGVEFASAFMPLPETMNMLQKFYKWAGSIGAEANASCGFHMGVSVPQHTRDTVDVMKFILFLGDEKVLADFGREASQWCKSSMAEIRKRIRSGNYDPKSALEEFRSGLNTEAAKMMKRRLLPTGDRYVSVNYKDDYIEIRSGGGNFFDQKDIIVNTMLRYVRVLGLAASPEEAQQEYAKKLYKVLSKHIRDESPDTVQYFAQYAAGQITKTALKSLVKQLQNTRDSKADSEIKYVIRKRDTGQVYDTLTAKNDPAAMEIYRAWLQRSNRGGWDYKLIRADDQKLVTVNWKLYKVLRRADDFEVHQFLAQDANIAQATLERWARATGSDIDNYMVVVANQQPSQQSQDDDLSDVDLGAWEPEPEPQRPAAQPAQANLPAWSPNARVAYQLLDRTGRAIAYFTDGTRMPGNSLFYAANSDEAGRRAADLDRVHGLPMGYLVRPFGRNESTEPRSLYQSIVEQEQLAELTQNPSAFRKFLNSEVANQVTMGFEAEMCIRGLNLNSRPRPNIPSGVDAEAVYPFDEEGRNRYYEFWMADNANSREDVSAALLNIRRRMDTWMRAHAEAEDVTPAHWKRFLRGGGHRNWTNMLELNRELDLEWPYGMSSDVLTRDQLKRDFQNSTGYQAELHGGYHTQRKPDDKFVFEFDGSIRARSGDGGQELVSYAMPLPQAISALDKMFAWANEKGYVYTNSSTGFHVNVGMSGLNTNQLDKMKLLLLLGDQKILEDFEREANDYCKSMFKKLYDQLSVRSDEQRAELLTAMKTDTWKGLRSMANRFVERAHSGEKYVSVNFKDNYIEFRSPGGDWMNHQSDIRDTVLRISQSYAAASSPTEGQQDYLKKAYKLLSGMNKGADDSMQLFVDYNMGKITAEQFAAQLVQRRGGTRTDAAPDQAAPLQAQTGFVRSAALTDINTGEYSENILSQLPRDMTIAQSWTLIDDDGDEVDSFTATAQEAVNAGMYQSESQPEYTYSLESDDGRTFATFSSGGSVYYAQWVIYAARQNSGGQPQMERYRVFYQDDTGTRDDIIIVARSQAEAVNRFRRQYPGMPMSGIALLGHNPQAAAQPATPADDDEENDEIDLGDLDQWEPEPEHTAYPARTPSSEPQQDRYRVFYHDADGNRGETIITAPSQPDAVNQFRRQYPTVTMSGIALTGRPSITRESIELDEVTQNPAVWDRFLGSDAAKKITMGFEAEMLVKGLASSRRGGINPDEDARIHNITTAKGQKRFREFWLQNGLNSEREVESALAYLGKNYPRIHRDLTDMSDLLSMELISLKWPFSNPNVLTRERLAQMFTDTTGYKVNVSSSATKDAFGMVSDGSLQPRPGDGGVELVSNAMPLPEAMQALNATFQWARDSKVIYTNSSSGFHVNVGLAGTTPKDIDKLKLLLLVGDQAILKEFGRMKNEYCASMLARLKKALNWKRTGKDPNNYGGWWDTNDILNKSDEEIDAVLAALRRETWAGLRNIANQLVDNLHNDDKYVSMNVHDKYIEFRSPGGNWLPKWDEIYYTVLRVSHAYALAADPVEGKQDYLKKAYKILSSGTEQNDELKTFIDFNMGKVNADKLKTLLGKKHQQGPVKKKSYGIQFKPKNGKKTFVHVFHTANNEAAIKYANEWVQKNLPEYANTNRWELHILNNPDLLDKAFKHKDAAANATPAANTTTNQPVAEAKAKRPKTIIDGAIKTLITKGRSEDEAIADLKKEVDKKFYTEEEQMVEGFIAEARYTLDDIMPDGDITYTHHYGEREEQRQLDVNEVMSLSRAAAAKYAAELASMHDESFVIISKQDNRLGMIVVKTERPDGTYGYHVKTAYEGFRPKKYQQSFFV